MLVYRARLDPGAETVLSASARPVAGAPAGSMQSLRVTLRYTVPGGAVRTHRGRLMAALPEGASLALSAWQVAEGEALLTFRVSLPPRRTGPGLALTDHFRLPLGLQSWGVTAVSGARVHFTAACRPAGPWLRVQGAVTVLLLTPGATFRLRVPFLRMAGVPDLEPGLRWQACGGVSGLRLRVEPGGRMGGEVMVGLRCEGRPAAPVRSGAVAPAPGEVRHVREVTGHVSRVAAEVAGAGQAVVRGMVELELWWLDREGRSRHTGRAVPFSVLAALEGAEAGDRLEAGARLERLAPEVQHGRVVVRALLSVSVTALRPSAVELGGVYYQLERIAGAGAASVVLAEELTAQPPDTPGDSVPDSLPVSLALEGPPDGWQDLCIGLEAPEVRAGQGRAAWRIGARLGSMPVSATGAAPLEPGQVLSVVAALQQFDLSGLHVSVRLLRGAPLPERAVRQGGSEPVERMIPLPGPVHHIISHTAGLRALLIQCEGGGLQALPAPGLRDMPAMQTLLAYPVQDGDQWQLFMSAT
ncbi:MAG TPA: hypothetical protein VD902_08615 [Symbiobacteriaceae bacterium]|nr:hypothetical protein [Symbiobacteriaceae bacterium]